MSQFGYSQCWRFSGHERPRLLRLKMTSVQRHDSVESCYEERMYRSAVQGLSPMRFEIAIRNECSDYEASLKTLYNKSEQKSGSKKSSTEVSSKILRCFEPASSPVRRVMPGEEV